MKTPLNFCFERWNSTNRTVPESFHPIYRERQRYGDPYRLPVHDGGRRQHPSSFGEPHQGPSMCAGRRQNPLRAIVDRQRMPVAYGGAHRRCRHWAYYWSRAFRRVGGWDCRRRQCIKRRSQEGQSRYVNASLGRLVERVRAEL